MDTLSPLWAYGIFNAFLNPCSPQSIWKHNPLIQLTCLNLKRLTGGVYAEISQAHIVLLFFQYFADLSLLIILGCVVSN